MNADLQEGLLFFISAFIRVQRRPMFLPFSHPSASIANIVTMQILVAEDDRRMAELLKRTLAEEGHQVVVAHDGREAFEIALYSPFDVIVLDVMLPGLSGTVVARKLREGRNQTPILM